MQTKIRFINSQNFLLLQWQKSTVTQLLGKGKVKSVYELSGLSGQADAYPGFRSMKRPTVALLPSGEMLVCRRVTPALL